MYKLNSRRIVVAILHVSISDVNDLNGGSDPKVQLEGTISPSSSELFLLKTPNFNGNNFIMVIPKLWHLKAPRVLNLNFNRMLGGYIPKCCIITHVFN